MPGWPNVKPLNHYVPPPIARTNLPGLFSQEKARNRYVLSSLNY